MGDNIFYDFENNRPYAEGLLDGISSGVCLFSISDEMKFLYFNQAADELFGYEKGGLLALTDEDSLRIFHPDFEDQLYSVMIASLREERLFHYDCRILCADGTYKWTNLSAQLQQKEGGRLYFYCVLSPTSAPVDILLKDCHFLIVSGSDTDCSILMDQIERMGGTYDRSASPLDALDLFYEACGISDELPESTADPKVEAGKVEGTEKTEGAEEAIETGETAKIQGAEERGETDDPEQAALQDAGEPEQAEKAMETIDAAETAEPVEPAEDALSTEESPQNDPAQESQAQAPSEDTQKACPQEETSQKESLQSEVYHSIFINSNLPSMNSLELTKEIRCCSGPAGESVPIILLSAENSETWDEEQEEEYMEAARELSVFAFLKKPLDQDDISAVLSSLSKLPV